MFMARVGAGEGGASEAVAARFGEEAGENGGSDRLERSS